MGSGRLIAIRRGQLSCPVFTLTCTQGERLVAAAKVRSGIPKSNNEPANNHHQPPSVATPAPAAVKPRPIEKGISHQARQRRGAFGCSAFGRAVSSSSPVSRRTASSTSMMPYSNWFIISAGFLSSSIVHPSLNCPTFSRTILLVLSNWLIPLLSLR